MSDPRIVFVLSPYQNAFFVELSEAISTALHAVGTVAVTTTEPGRFDVGDDDVFVLMPPHEYVALEGSDFVDADAVAARTIGISAEQPHQGFFERNASIGGRLGARLDFSPLAVAAYREHGLDAVHLPFGYVPEWDRVPGRRPEGVGDRRVTTPVLYLGNKAPRRLSALAAASEQLVAHRARLIVSDNAEPNRTTTPTFLAGDDKRSLLAATGLLINIHQSDEPYFEWLRFVDAAHCGVPVLTETSRAADPFVDGAHFLSFEPGRLGPTLDAVAADRERLVGVARAAYDLLRSRPLTDGVGALVDTARSLLGSPPPTALPARRRHVAIGRDRLDPVPSGAWRRPGRVRSALRSAAGRRAGSRWELVAPEGTALHVGLDEIAAVADDAAFVNVVAHGLDLDGSPMLEGHWPWEPWRLSHGEHLGRVLVVDREVLRAARAWLVDPLFATEPHLVVELFAAANGLRGAHWPNPAAELRVPVDPSHSLAPDVAARCRELLTASEP